MISSNKLYAPLIDKKDEGDKKNEVNLFLSILFIQKLIVNNMD